MSRRSVRYGGMALAGAVAIGCLVQQAGDAPAANASLAAMPAAPSAGFGHAFAALSPQAQTLPAVAAAPAATVIPALSHLVIPDVTVSASSTGFAGQDLAVDLAPDLASRNLAFVLQKLNGSVWSDAYRGSTTGSQEAALLRALPAGSYRVVVPAQYGMHGFVGAPFQHQPRQLTATTSFDPGSVRTTVDINPDASDGYRFRLESKSGKDWVFVGDFTTDNGGGRAFDDLASGTYRIVVPDQADAIGTTSNDVAVTSREDQQAAAAAKQAAQQARQARKARGQAAARAASPAIPSSPAGEAAPPMPGSGDVIGTAVAQVGDSYRRGGTGPNVFDCSGLTQYSYRAAGIAIPRTAAAQYQGSQHVSSPQPGDLVFFLNGASHVGIYLGNGMMVHAATPRHGVEISSIHGAWYAKHFTGFGRY